VPLAGEDASLDGFCGNVEARRRFTKQFLVSDAISVSVEMMRVLLVAPRMARHVGGRARERRAVRRPECRDERGHYFEKRGLTPFLRS
jgi:hypothetical protein